MVGGIPFLDLLSHGALPKRLTRRAVELKDIKAIIDLMRKNELSVFEMEKDGFKLKLQKGGLEGAASAAPITVVPAIAPALAQQQPAAPSAAATEATAAASAEKSSFKEITSPMVGTFYRSPSPDAPMFVDVGQTVTEETVVCIIEAMKVMNEIKAEMHGIVREIIVKNSQAVEFGEVLFLIEKK